MVSADAKYQKAALLVFGNKVKRTMKGFSIDYFSIGDNNVSLGIDTVTGKDRTGCDCIFESLQGAKYSLACSHLIASVIYKCLKPLLDKKHIKILIRDFNGEYKELKLKDEKD